MSGDLKHHKDNLAKMAFGETKGLAHSKGTCIACKSSVAFDIAEAGVPGNICTPAGLKEYGISGLCETCFDNMFAEDE